MLLLHRQWQVELRACYLRAGGSDARIRKASYIPQSIFESTFPREYAFLRSDVAA